MQVVSWLFKGKKGFHIFKNLVKKTMGMEVKLGADDLADAYHGVPNSPSQLCLCVVAIMNPKTQRI